MIKIKKFRDFPLYKTWTESQIEQIHLATLGVLERTGVDIHEEEAIKLLKDAGAYVIGKRVRIPAKLVEWAIRSAPSMINLYSKDGSTVLPLDKGCVNYGMGADLPYFIDPYSQEIRRTVLADTKRASRCARNLENVDWVSSLGLASDVTTEFSDLYQYLAICKYCNKPIMTHAANRDTLKGMIDMAAVSVGGHEQLRQKPILAVYTEPISPLVHSKESIEKLLLCAEYGIPVTYATGSICGGTAPATLAAGIATANAECLTGLVIHQLKQPGAPFIHGMLVGVLDMKTTISPYGGPEMTLVHTVGGQLAHFYELPSFGTAGYTDAFTVDTQAGMDAMYSVLFAALSDTHLVHDSGYMGSGISGSLEQLLLADEIIGYVKRFMEGIIMKDNSYLDVIDSVGPGGDYSSVSESARIFKKEVWKPGILNRLNLDDWIKAGSKGLYERLNERVLEFLKEDEEMVLSQFELEEMQKVIKEHEFRIKN